MTRAEAAAVKGDTPKAGRAERAAVRALAAQVAAARRALGQTLSLTTDDDDALEAAVEARLTELWWDRLEGRRLPGDLPSAVSDLLARPLDGPFAVRLARAHEHTRAQRLARRRGEVALIPSPERRSRGVYYTPPDVVRFIVAETLGAHLASWEQALLRASRAEALEILAAAQRVRVLDPACGAGAFLLGALARLRRFYQRLAERLTRRRGALPPELEAPGRLALRANLRGLDLDRRALDLAELALLAEVADEPGRPRPLVGQALAVGDHLDDGARRAFPDAFERDDPGFDVVLGNPPYARLTGEQRARAEAQGFRTAACSDIYAAFVEGLVRLGRASGRGGLIVPLSLGFSRNLRAAREQVIAPSGRAWRLASFDRIPSGLFESEVRTRTTIVLCGPAQDRTRVRTTPLLRFTAAQRPQVFADLRYVDVTELTHPLLGYPRLDSPLQAAGLARLFARGQRLGEALDPEGAHRLHFKHNCYGFLIVAAELPPATDAAGAPIAHTKYSSLGFADAATRDAALALLAGAWGFWWWRAYGDGFDVTGRLLSAFPIDPRALPARTRRALAARGRRIQARVADHVAWKKNGGKRIGTFDLRACRDLTRAADDLVARALEATDLLADVRASIERTHGAG